MCISLEILSIKKLQHRCYSSPQDMIFLIETVEKCIPYRCFVLLENKSCLFSSVDTRRRGIVFVCCFPNGCDSEKVFPFSKESLCIYDQPYHWNSSPKSLIQSSKIKNSETVCLSKFGSKAYWVTKSHVKLFNSLYSTKREYYSFHCRNTNILVIWFCLMSTYIQHSECTLNLLCKI